MSRTAEDIIVERENSLENTIFYLYDIEMTIRAEQCFWKDEYAYKFIEKLLSVKNKKNFKISLKNVAGDKYLLDVIDLTNGAYLFKQAHLIFTGFKDVDKLISIITKKVYPNKNVKKVNADLKEKVEKTE